jgi:DNA-directed RNA polymerase specialized sigma24 family protein
VVGRPDAPVSGPGEQAELALLVASGLNAHEISATMGWPLSKVYRRLVLLRVAIERRTASRLRTLQHRRNNSRVERKS